MSDGPWWNVIVNVGQERFGGIGDSLAEAVANLRSNLTLEEAARALARQAIQEELDRVRL